MRLNVRRSLSGLIENFSFYHPDVRICLKPVLKLMNKGFCPFLPLVLRLLLSTSLLLHPILHHKASKLHYMHIQAFHFSNFSKIRLTFTFHCFSQIHALVSILSKSLKFSQISGSSQGKRIGKRLKSIVQRPPLSSDEELDLEPEAPINPFEKSPALIGKIVDFSNFTLQAP